MKHNLRHSLVLLLPVIAVACGSAATPTAAPAATSAPAAGTVDKTGWPAQFSVGLFASDDAQKVLNGAEPLRAYLEKELGIPVKVTTGTSYSAVIEAMRAKKVDAMEVGPLAFVIASKVAGAVPLAVAINPVVKPGVTVTYDSKLIPYYYSTIFTLKGSGVNTLDDLKGKGFNFVDPASTSGYMMPSRTFSITTSTPTRT